MTDAALLFVLFSLCLEVAGGGGILDHSTLVANIIGFAARSVEADFVRLVEQIIAPLFPRNWLEYAS
jgi:hypothetical protein